MSDLSYWIAFNKTPQIGSAKVQRLLEYFGDLERAWRANESELIAAGLDKRALASLLATREQLDLARELVRATAACDAILTWDDPAYPQLLREIPSPPPILYLKGEMTREDEFALAVVGTRRASAYGREVTRTLVTDLVRNHITIVSGLARGIDAEAHRATLDAGGRTLAVLGSGIDVIYPPEHRDMAQQIAKHGALISEYPIGTEPEGGNFPPRNRIISGLSLGSLIVEGDEKSGAMITVDFALEQDREVFAVPGNLFRRESRGTNKLIRDSRAKLVTGVNDILEELNLQQIGEVQSARAALPENDIEATLMKLLSRDPLHVDDLRQQANLPIAQVSSTLTLLELKGMVKQVGTMNYILAREATEDYGK